jgi:vitamin B12 transporter
MKSHVRAALCCGLSVGILYPIAQADDNRIVVTASRIESTIEETGSSISVVTSEQIKRQNAKNLQEAMKLVPGLIFVANGGPGSASSVHIRGAESDHTLVLINGVRVNGNTEGGFDYTSIPAHMIESIEVVRGPQSGLYGADAMGGVVNVITKKMPQGTPGGSITIAAGEQGYYEGRVSAYGGNDKIDVFSALSYYNLDDHDIARNQGGTEEDPYDRLSFYNNIGFNFAGDGRADISILYVEDDAQLDGFQGADTLEDEASKKKIFVSVSARKSITERITQSLKLGYNQQDYEGFVSGLFGGPVDYSTVSYDASLQTDIQTADNNIFSLGYDARLTEAENVGNFDKEDREQHAVFIGNAWNWEETLYVNLSGRFDNYSDIDDQATWKADTSWFVLDSTRLHGSVGTAYRAPTMNDLYFTYGAPARTYLQPEESLSFDLGIQQYWMQDKLMTDITYFRSDVEELIEWTPTGIGTIWEPRNIAEADIQGVELMMNIKPNDKISADAFATYLDATNAETGKELNRRAKWTAGCSVYWNYSDKGSIYSDLTYTGDRFEDIENSTELDSYTLVGLGTRYQLTDHLEIFGHISNLTDEDYETASGYATVGRLASVGITGTL